MITPNGYHCLVIAEVHTQASLFLGYSPRSDSSSKAWERTMREDMPVNPFFELSELRICGNNKFLLLSGHLLQLVYI